MDVTCERCGTEYEFDDALVSERGTTVKCTNCGHLFKVRRTDGILPEKWLVSTVDGREIEFTMLRELQAAIARAEIGRDDVLSRGSSRPRRLGSIAELEPFFRGAGALLTAGTVQGLGGPSMVHRARNATPQGLGGPVPSGAPAHSRDDDGPDSAPESESETVVMVARPSAPPPAATSAPVSSEPIISSGAGRIPIVPPTPAPMDVGPTARGSLPGVVVGPGEAPPLPDGYVARASDEGSQPASTDEGGGHLRMGREAEADNGERSRLPVRTESAVPRTAELVPPVVGVVTPPPMPTIRELDPLEAPTRPDATPARGSPRPISSIPPSLTPTPGDVRVSLMSDDAYGDPRFSSMTPSTRGGVGRWVVGVLVAGLTTVAVVTLAPRYLKSSAPPPAHTADERVMGLVGEGERSLIDGDLETARDKLVKASALAEDDPRVATDLARLETISADVRWLRVRLLAGSDPERDVAKHDLDAAIARARAAAEHAQQVAPSEVAVTRARVDLLRLQGDVEGARKLVGSISTGSSQPENALTLAALDLAEDKPSWPVAIERLKAATSGEQHLGRARALLVYALARSGDLAGARLEQERLASMARPHPLSAALRAFIDRQEEQPVGAKPAASATVASSASSVGGTPPSPGPWKPSLASSANQAHDRVPNDVAAPSGTIDASDLLGQTPLAPVPTATSGPTAPSPPPLRKPSPVPSNTTPPPIDTSDLAGIKNE